MDEMILQTKAIFDWYKSELQNLAKIVNGYEEHRKVVFKASDFLTNEKNDLPCLIKLNPLLRSGLHDINLKQCYWISEAKRDRIKTFEYFARKILSEKSDKLASITEKYGERISLKQFE